MRPRSNWRNRAGRGIIREGRDISGHPARPTHSAVRTSSSSEARRPVTPMKIRNTAFAAAIVAIAALFAPVYGPVIRARAASNGTDDLGKDMKTVADAFA